MVLSSFKYLDLLYPKNGLLGNFKTVLGGLFTILLIVISILLCSFFFKFIQKNHTAFFIQSTILEETNFIKDKLFDKYVQIQLYSPQFNRELKKRLELNTNFIRKTDKSVITVLHSYCEDNIKETTLCYRFYFDDYIIYYNVLKEKLVYNLKVYLNYRCEPNCHDDIYYKTNIIDLEINGFIKESIISPIDNSIQSESKEIEIFSSTINSEQYSSFNIKLKKRRTEYVGNSFLSRYFREPLPKSLVGFDKVISNYIFYTKGISEEKKKILLNFNVDFLSNTTELFQIREEDLFDILPRILSILIIIILVLYLINNFFSTRRRNLELINSIYDFYDDNEKMNIIKTKKMLERKSMSMINLKEKLLPLTEIVVDNFEDEVKIIDQTLDLDVFSDDNTNKNKAKKIASCKVVGGKKNQIENKKEKPPKSLTIKSAISPKFSTGVGRIGFLRKFSRKQNPPPLEQIEEVEENKEKLITSTHSVHSFSRKESSGGSDVVATPPRKLSPFQVIPEVRKIGTLNLNNNAQRKLMYNLRESRSDSSIIGDIMVTINSKKRLEITNIEFVGIALFFHLCNWELKRKYDLYKNCIEKIHSLLDYKNVTEKLYDIEKLKYVLFNSSQNYAFSSLSKPLIMCAEDGNIIAHHDLMRKRKKYFEDTSKEETLRFMLHNSYDCKSINQKLLKLIRPNN
jgi:hypothetical protein